MNRFRNTSHVAMLALALVLVGEPAHAAIFPVGSGIGCGYETIQAAVDHAATYPGDNDFIHVSRSRLYNQQAITVGDQTVQIIGGFDTCQDLEPSGKTTVSGTGGLPRSVFRILGNGRVTLRNLTISGGDAGGGSEGGGIYYQGNGTLDIADSDIINNLAGYGGGIYARGTGAAAELLIGANVTVANNTARYSGGGVYIDQLAMAMREPNSGIFYNFARGDDDSGYGGGLTIRAAQRSAYADVGSGGIANAGAIFANEARYGGGVAVVGGDGSTLQYARLQMFTTDPAKPAAIRENVASVAGGGVFVADYDDLNGYIVSYADFYNARLDDNEAPRGAAAFVDGDGSDLRFNPAIAPPGGTTPCGPSTLCGGIAANRVEDVDGNPVGGAVIELVNQGTFQANENRNLSNGQISPRRGGIDMRANVGGRLILGADDGAALVSNALVTANEVSADLISMTGSVELFDTTIAGNSIGAAHVIWGGRITRITGSILWQPILTMIAGPATSVEVSDTIASEILSLNGGGYYAPPRFIDPARGNYGLRAASAAVDFRAPRTGETGAYRDALANPRNTDLALIPNFRGPIDVGAIESLTPFPLVLNGNFAVDRNLWSNGTSGSSSWDPAQNYPTSPGGSVYVSGPAFEAVGSAQCVHLPVATRYKLNGAGRNAVATNYVNLRWEFRRDGGESCTNGSPDRSGSILLSDTTAWAMPSTSVRIDVAESEWTNNSSITITMVASGRAPGGWFDAIYLDTENLVDRIFADGFDS